MSYFSNAQNIDYTKWVNPLMGTMSKPSFSNGNTYPAVGVPWGMNLWTAQTGKNGDGWMYRYDADKIVGFKQTHQPSPWMNDYGQFSMMATVNKLAFKEEDRGSWFNHKSETVTPYFYQTYLADYNVTVGFTPTERAAQFQFTFPKSDSAFIVIDAFDKGSYIKVDAANKKVYGYSTQFARGPLTNFKNYFIIEFDKAFTKTVLWKDSFFVENIKELQTARTGAVIQFHTSEKEKITARVGTSFISFEQAQLNLNRELGSDDFEQTKAKAKQLWNDKLGVIKVEGGSEAQMRTFYSCLYRTLFFPHKMYEINDKNKAVHYSPYDGKVYDGYRFAGTGFWDTFRALYPLLNLFYPSINKEMQEGLINDYKEGGWLPEWSSPAYSDIMIGNNSASIVAEAYIKGLRGYDIEKLYEALIHGANKEGPISAIGRKGAAYYNDLGYVPFNVGIHENAARTLEYAYNDFCIYQLGKALGKPKAETDLYYTRAMNYKNLFDKEYNLMRGKNKDGTFQSPFNPFKWGGAFTEGNSWHYTWSVFQDINGLINLMGGKEKFVQQLDKVFSLPPIFDDSYYGFVIHEIREMQVADMGQYAHGNQPIQHMTYLYNYSGVPHKTQYWVRETMNRMYSAQPDGYCGDEDNGQTSAWYVFSALGFYPVTPAVDEYVLGAPLFKKATIQFENGKKLVIQAPQNSIDNKYVQQVVRNEKKENNLFLKHKDVLNGGVLQFDMVNKPVLKEYSNANLPFSMSKK